MENIKPYKDNSAIVFQFSGFVEFIDRGQRTTKTYLNNLRQFAAWMRYKAVEAPTRAHIIAYRDFLMQPHDGIRWAPETASGWAYREDNRGNRVQVVCRPNTVKQYLQTVKQFFKWTASEGLYPNIAENIHAPKIKQDRHRKEALSPADVVAIEKSILSRAEQSRIRAEQMEKDTAGAIEQGKRLYAMYLLAVNCGLRTIELHRANIKDLETVGGITYLYIWGKGHTEPDTRKALAPEVATAIYDYLESRTGARGGSSPLFTATGNRSGGKRIATTTISTMLKRAMQEAGYNSERITAHSLRHTAGTNIQEITGNLYATQKYMRHSNPATTEIYLHNNTERLEADLARQLYDHYHSQDFRPHMSGKPKNRHLQGGTQRKERGYDGK